MVIFLYALSIIWTIAGILIVMGAWDENEDDYEQIIGQIAQPLELSYEEHDTFSEPRVVMSKIYLKDDQKEYRLRGKLYHLNREGMESLQLGDNVRLMVKKTSIIGGFKINDSSKTVSISGIYSSDGEVIIPLEKGIDHAKQRLLIGFGLIAMGLFVGIWTYLKY